MIMRKLIFVCWAVLASYLVAHTQNIRVESLKGEQVLFSEIIKGDTPVIVSFWATWCKPCMSEMEALKELKEDWQGRVRVVSISIDDARSKGKVPALIKARNFPFEVYMDSNQDLSKKLNVQNVPFVFIYHKGKQVYKHSGYNPGDEDYLLDKALGYAKQ